MHSVRQSLNSAADSAVAVCLCMIVRDEEPCIARCLQSVRDFITHWAIVDTGSQDATTDIVQSSLQDIPGKLIREPWVFDFAKHRNQSVDLARRVVGGAHLRMLFIDADEVLVVRDQTAFRSALAGRESFAWWAVDGDWHHRKLGVVDVDDFDCWQGEIHEYVKLKRPSSSPNRVRRFAHLHYGHDGFRRRNHLATADDYRALRVALERSAECFRPSFFLARTYEVQGDLEAAAYWFRVAAEARSAPRDDRWQALWGLGRVLRRDDLHASCNAFLRAYQLVPTRAESLVCLAEVARLQGQDANALTLSSAALDRAEPSATSMYDRSAYGWRAADEMCLAAMSLGNSPAMWRAAQKYRAILRASALPESERSRVEGNLLALLSTV